MAKEWGMNPEDFNRFLAWLDPNPEEASHRYEQIHRWLIRLFRAWGCPEVDAEELTDETITRVVSKMREIADSYVGTREPYIRKVAHYVFMEYLRARPATPPPPQPPHDSSEEKERRDQCLEHCLNELPPGDRDVVLRYYAEDKRAKIERRREQAEQLGMTLNALRIYVCRVRDKLRRCIADCLEKLTS